MTPAARKRLAAIKKAARQMGWGKPETGYTVILTGKDWKWMLARLEKAA